MKMIKGFNTHITNICNGVSKKLHSLAKISQFTSGEYRE